MPTERRQPHAPGFERQPGMARLISAFTGEAAPAALGGGFFLDGVLSSSRTCRRSESALSVTQPNTLAHEASRAHPFGSASHARASLARTDPSTTRQAIKLRVLYRCGGQRSIPLGDATGWPDVPSSRTYDDGMAWPTHSWRLNDKGRPEGSAGDDPAKLQRHAEMANVRTVHVLLFGQFTEPGPVALAELAWVLAGTGCRPRRQETVWFWSGAPGSGAVRTAGTGPRGRAQPPSVRAGGFESGLS
eukprot:scaffold25542_cov39-Phaeocystis_antarctica.AAC.2